MKAEKSFGDTVRRLREEKNLPLREVAEALKIDISMLSKIEKNNRRPSQLIIEKIAKFYKVSDRDLTIAFLSDTIAYQVMDREDFAIEAIKVAEKKVKYFKAQKSLE